MIETKTIPVPPYKGLHLDGVIVPGGMSKANNVFILPDGSAERRLFQRTLDEGPACLASRGLKNVYELRKSDGTRYLFADVDNSDTAIASFGAETITHYATWTPTSGWTFGSSIWTHSAGTTSLVAVGETAVVATTKYRVVVDVTQTPPSSSAAGWAFTSVDSGLHWINENGNEHTIWLIKWTHTTGTTALTATRNFDVVAGESYRIFVHATHTSGTSLSVYIGGTLAGTITSSGDHEFIARFVTNTTALRFVPTSNWVGSIDVSWFPIPASNDKISVKKLIDPAGANIPSNLEQYDTATNMGLLAGGWPMITWYPEEAAQLSQSLAVYIGGTLAGVIQESGEYSYDVTATNTTALTFTPTTSWIGSINSASVMVETYDAVASTKMKVIGGTVTGTTDYETSWGNVVTNLTSGTAILPVWATMQDKAFRVDGTNINYYFINTSAAHTLGVPAPVDAPVIANTTGGEIALGTYNVWYTYVKEEGDKYTEGNPSPSSNITLTGTDTAITVNVIANTDSDITHIYIYRTLLNEEGSDSARATEVLNYTQTVTLILSDDTIGDSGYVLEYNHDMPKLAMFALTGGSRLWLLRFPGEVGGDSMCMWSETGEPEYFPALNYQTFDPDDGDKIMGAAMLKDNLLIFKRHRTFIMNMYSFAKDIVSPTIGCVASGSIQSVGVNSAIWLSSEGFMLYDGGEPKNISKDKINSVINSFMANGAEPYIDSVYHSTKRQYHVNFLYRTGAVITSQRHFVYSLDSDAWTEYVYTSTGGVRYYEINFCLASDSNLNEVILIPYLVTSSDTIAYIYQSDYGLSPSSSEIEILDSAGDGVTPLEYPIYSFTDTNDNVYVVTWKGTIFKVTPAGVKSTIITAADIIAELGTFVGHYVRQVIPDLDNNCIYLNIYNWRIIRITLAGVITSISLLEHDYRIICGLNSDKTAMYAVKHINNNGTLCHPNELYKITSLTSPTPTHTLLYTFPTNVNFEYNSLFTVSAGLTAAIYDGDLYYISTEYTTVNPGDGFKTGNFYLGILSDIEGTKSNELFDTGIVSAGYLYGFNTMTVVSTTEVAIGYIHNSDFYILRGRKTDAIWSFDTVVQALDTLGNYDPHEIQINSSGNFVVGGSNDRIRIYDSNWQIISTITSASILIALGTSYLQGTTAKENIFIICNYDNDNVFKIYSEGYWEIITNSISDSESVPTMSGTIVDIVSNYEDLGMSNDKRVKRIYLDIESQYATCGYATIEPDYTVNKNVHTPNEMSEPSGATSLRPFAHPGRQTWEYTNDQFDGAVEAWQDTRLDIGTQGKKFRYSIKIGDAPTANHGILRIKPPKILVQLKGIY